MKPKKTKKIRQNLPRLMSQSGVIDYMPAARLTLPSNIYVAEMEIFDKPIPIPRLARKRR